MKRGIIRIIGGVALLILQVLSMIGQSAINSYVTPSLWFYIGFYSPAITGIILFVFGLRAYRNEIYSELVLHSNNKKIHTVIKWVGVTLSALLFVYYLISFIVDWSDFDIFTLLNLFGMMAVAVYSLFYMYKKPSCLFSAALIFIGAAYIYGIISNLSYYILYLPDTDYFIPYIFMCILPRVIAGILYIVAATILYKEDFSVKTIRILGLTIFALEMLNRVVYSIVVLQSIYFADLLELTYLLFVVVVLLYMSVLKVNSLRDTSTPTVKSIRYYKQKIDHSFDVVPVPDAGWRCGDGKPKLDNITRPQSDETTSETINENLFCRKCGAKLPDESLFCSKCGTEVIKA